MTKSKAKAFADSQRTSECFVGACLQPQKVSIEVFSGRIADQMTHKWKMCDWQRNKWMTSVIKVKHKWL